MAGPRRLAIVPAAVPQLAPILRGDKAPLRPRIATATCDGMNESNQLVIPAGATVIQISPRTLTVTLQFAFQPGESNSVGKFASLLSGQAYEARTNAGEYFAETVMVFFAAAALTVDVVFY